MPDSEDTEDTEDTEVARTITEYHTASRFYRRKPGAAWWLALLAIPLLLALIGWAGLKKPEVDVTANLPSVSPSAVLTAPDVKAPDVNAPDVNAPDVNAPDLNFGALSIVRNPNGFALSGELPSLEAKTGLLDSLKLAFGQGIQLTDNLKVNAGVKAPDFALLGSIFGAAAGIRDFNFDLNGDTLTLNGAAPSEKSKSEVEAAAKAAYPGMKVVNEITIAAPSAPASPPAPAPASPPAPAPASGACSTLQADIAALLKTPINFQTDGSTLTAGSRQQLTQIADKLKACPDPKVSVVGHTDSSGNDAINVPLSTNRAKSVADYLVSQGVAGGRVTSKGVGASQPVAPNNTPAGKAQNRRVDITVS